MKEAETMNLTAKHLIDTAYKEFSSHRIEQFTIMDLSRKSKVSRGSIYYHFECIDCLYKAILDQIIEKVTDGCNSSDDLLIGIVNYIAENKNLCLNLYYQNVITVRDGDIIKELNKLILKYDKIDSSKKTERGYLIGVFLVIIRNWLDDNLSTDKDIIIKDLLNYNRLLKSI